ncbi:MAG: hypothetical protein ACO1RX_16685 [Candidatus Sericytochromatia bacterium]
MPLLNGPSPVWLSLLSLLTLGVLASVWRRHRQQPRPLWAWVLPACAALVLGMGLVWIQLDAPGVHFWFAKAPLSVEQLPAGNARPHETQTTRHYRLRQVWPATTTIWVLLLSGLMPAAVALALGQRAK